MIDVVFVVRGDRNDVASSKYRVYQYLNYLSQNNIKYKVIKPPRRKIVHGYLWIPWVIKLFLFGIKSKKIFVQKDIFSLGFWKFFKRCGKKIIYDFDDAIFVESTTRGKHVYSFPFERRSSKELVSDMLRLSDLVIVANNYLEEFSKSFTQKTLIIPMNISPSEYLVKAHEDSYRDSVVIGWIGSPQTSRYLTLIQDALERITLFYGQKVKIKVVTNGLVQLPKIEFQQVPWDQEKEIENIHSFDIGLVPLPKDSFALGKSSFKLLQYMACGLPTVCSGGGFNEEVIVDGENGFLAREIDEWEYKLRQLIEDSKLRSKLGIAARKTIEKKYSLEINSNLFFHAITNI